MWLSVHTLLLHLNQINGMVWKHCQNPRCKKPLNKNGRSLLVATYRISSCRTWHLSQPNQALLQLLPSTGLPHNLLLKNFNVCLGKNGRQMLVDLVWPSMQCGMDKILHQLTGYLNSKFLDPWDIWQKWNIMKYLTNVAVHIWYFEPSPCDIYIYIHTPTTMTCIFQSSQDFSHEHLYIPSNTYVTGTKSCIGTPVITHQESSFLPCCCLKPSFQIAAATLFLALFWLLLCSRETKNLTNRCEKTSGVPPQVKARQALVAMKQWHVEERSPQPVILSLILRSFAKSFGQLISTQRLQFYTIIAIPFRGSQGKYFDAGFKASVGAYFIVKMAWATLSGNMVIFTDSPS